MSFLNELELMLERKDVPFSDNILKMTDKILKFIKVNRRRLFSVAYYDTGKSYYIKYSNIDTKSKINDLWIALMKIDESAIDDKNLKNPAALATMQDKRTGEKDYVLRLYIFKSVEDMEQNVSSVINQVIASPSWQSNIYHELTHYVDTKRQKVTSSYDVRDFISDNDVTKILDKIKKYHNLTDEINAHFIQSATAFWHVIKRKYLDIMTMPFDKFKEAFIYFYSKKAFENLNDDNRKRILKRIYSMYEELKETIEKKKKKK